MSKPKNLLYSINARIGGYGLDLNAAEAIKLPYNEGYLGKAFGYANRQAAVPARYIANLRHHPVRLMSFLSSPFYYDAKKRYVDWIAARQIATGRYDFFHGWENNSLLSLRAADRLGIPSVLEIPTWHRDKGVKKPRDIKLETRHETEARFPETLFKSLIIKRPETLEEYDRADLLLVPSECSARTFLVGGIPREKLFMLGAGVDLDVFRPADPARIPAQFTAERPMQAIYTGALIKRKGAHVLLKAWHRLRLPHARLTLVGAIHPEIQPFLKEFGGPTVNAAGFSSRTHELLRESDIHIFPSECEGSAKTVYEACATGLAQISTFESGDVVQDRYNGWIVPPNDPTQLASAIQHAYDHPEQLREYGGNARLKAERELTWDCFRAGLSEAYSKAIELRRLKITSNPSDSYASPAL